MKNLLRVTMLAICAIFMVANVSAQDNYNATTMGSIVRYYETAKWAQGSPFNNQCWTSATQQTHAKTGCVPTAFAIVMRHHGFPAEGIGTLYNQQTGEVFTDRTYDYSKMPLTNSSSWTTEQQNEVAKLMAHLGHAFGVTFGQGATSVSIGNTMSERMQKFFNYNYTPVSNQYAGSGQMYDFEEWKKNLKNSLDNGCPVPYAADNKKDGTNDSRHMFVIDGYTENEYFHFNFGWGGGSNGWYKLDDITPTGDDYSWRTTSDGYDSKHQAFFNLMPNATKYTVTATANPTTMGTVSINNGTAGSTVTADLLQGVTATLTAHPADGYALASWTKGGVIVGTRNTLQVPVGTSGNDYVANFADEANVLVEKDCTFKISDVTTSGLNGSYCSTWTTSDGIVLSCSKGSEPAYALSTTVNTFFAKAPVGNSETLVSDITYTLTAPAGYIIKSYSFKGKSPSSSYTIDVTIGGNTTNVTNASAGVVISASDINAQSTSFILGSTYAGRAGLSILENGITVTIQSEGGGSTPTPDPEPEPEPDPTPTTYNITAEASPQNAGKVAINGGTQSTVANIDATSGSTVSLQAYPNSGYEFAGWYNGTTKVSSDNPYSITATAAVSYIASFQEVQQGGSSSDDLAGRYFRLKEKSTGTYMNIYDNETHSDGAKGGVNVTTKNESNDAQIFQFIESGTNYKLLSKTGYYIYCQSWNVDAYSTTSTNGTELTFEPTATELEYLINCAKGYFKIGPVNQNPSLGNFVYCDAASNAAATWVLEEVIPSNEKTLNVTYSGATWNNATGSWWVSVVTNTTPAVTVKTTDGTPKIGYSTFNGVRHPYLLDGNSFTISVPANCKITGYRLGYQAHNLVSKTVTYTNGKQSTGTVTITQSNEQNTLTVTELNNSEIAISVADQSAQAGFIIKSLEITYVENEFEPLPFKAEIEGWRNDNPNTHLGTITIGGTAMKLTPAHQTASELTMPLAEGTALAFTRKYRGFEFNGFYIGSTSLGENPTLTADNVAAISDATPLVAKFTATDDVTLFYDDDTYSYRIPAIAKTGTNRLVAVSDYRHSHDDIGRDNHGTGTNRVDLVMRTSDDNGATWSAKQTIAEGTSTFGYGDAAIVANGENILVMAVAGNVFYPYANATKKNKTYRIYSNNNGQSWTKEEVTSNIFGLFDEAYATFFGSGKLAVDPNFNGTGKARVYGAILLKNSARSTNNYVLFSDDWGATWNILGGSKTQIAEADEPKVEILPNGQILLSSRHASGGSRVFNVFTYGNDKAAGEGTWGTAVSGCSNGGSNGTNGEIICLDAKQTNGKPTKILLQSQPQGGSNTWDRKDVTIWYKEIGNETQTPSSIADGWTKGKQVSTVQSAYSAMTLQENGEIAFFFEEAPCHNDDNTYGYSMVYVPLTIEEITENNFLNPNADVEYVPTEFNIVLTDAQDNEYCETLDYIPNGVAAVESYLTTTYPFITLGNVGAIADNKYTNTVTLPFKVSNAENTYWHNIYWPAYLNPGFYPIYLTASKATDTYVPKVTEAKVYGESQYNTLAHADKLSWAVYSVNNTLTFKFKNKLTGKFMAVNGVVSSGNDDNVIYTEETNATAFTLTKNPGTNNNWQGDYAITSVYNSTTGYVCNTSASYAYATNYASNTHPGAWAKFVEAPDYVALIEEVNEALAKFGDAAGQYTPYSEDIDDIAAARTAMENSGSLVLNELDGYKAFATEALARATENYTLYVTSAGYATMYLGYPAAIPAEVEAYTVTEVNDGYVTLTQVEGAIPANTGIIVKAAEGNYTFAYSKETPATVAGNLLEGTVDATEINVEAYVLGIVDGEVGLYKAKMTDGKWLNNANKAYLPANEVPNKSVAFYGFDWDGTTGVEKVEIRNEKEEIYDLCGRRIESITSPGIYIVNGRKVLIK